MFDKLNEINVLDKTEKKGGLTYLPWAYAWQTLKLHCPDAQYTVYENRDGLNYHHDSITAWVKVGVTVNELEHIEYLPVMDFRNKSITVDKLTSFDVNKTIKRALVKAIAMHGLGITIYAGEDLPEQPTQPTKQPASNGNPSKTTYDDFVSYLKAQQNIKMGLVCDYAHALHPEKYNAAQHVLHTVNKHYDGLNGRQLKMSTPISDSKKAVEIFDFAHEYEKAD